LTRTPRALQRVHDSRRRTRLQDALPEQGSRIVVIENGYDAESFAGLAGAGRAHKPLNPGAVTVLHSGIVYPSERDPTWLFAALARLVDEQRLVRGKFKIRFRAAVHDELLRTLAQQHRLGNFVEVLPQDMALARTANGAGAVR
jgi:glycosyltransferase involved in cell wall biosynthesis